MILTIFGSLGALCILIAFILLQFEKLHHDDLAYDVLNLVGSLILVIYGVILMTYPFVVLNSVWVVISLRDVIAHHRKTPKGIKGLFYKIGRALKK